MKLTLKQKDISFCGNYICVGYNRYELLDALCVLARLSPRELAKFFLRERCAISHVVVGAAADLN